MLKTRDKAMIGLIVAALFGVFALDLYVPLGTAVWLLYMVPIALGLATRVAVLPLVVAVVACLFMIAAFAWDSGGIDPRLAALNRTLAGLVFLILGVVMRSLIVNREALSRDAWLRKGEAVAASAVLGDLTARQVADGVLSAVADRVGARAAVLYSAQAGRLHRLADWGVDRTALSDREAVADGHLLRALGSDRPVSLTLDPGQALGWRSGLAGGRAPHALIVPLRLGHEAGGVMEFG